MIPRRAIRRDTQRVWRRSDRRHTRVSCSGLLQLIHGVVAAIGHKNLHGVGGIVGSLLTGLLADPRIGGVGGDVLTQLLAVAAVALYSAVGTLLVLGVVRVLVGLRVEPDVELAGLDLAEHRERLGH